MFRRNNQSVQRLIFALILVFLFARFFIHGLHHDLGPPSAARGGMRPLVMDPRSMSPDLLCLLPGIGPAQAEPLAVALQAGVGVLSREELLAVPGIGPKRADLVMAWLGEVREAVDSNEGEAQDR